MGDLSNFESTINRLRGFDFKAEMTDAIIDGKNKLLDMQATQMFSGKDANDDPILLDGDGYSPFTMDEKVRKGQPIDRVTLRDTGKMYAALQLEVESDMFAITSDVPYFRDVQERTGSGAFMPDEANRLDFAESIVLPTVGAALLDKTGLVITTN